MCGSFRNNKFTIACFMIIVIESHLEESDNGYNKKLIHQYSMKVLSH